MRFFLIFVGDAGAPCGNAPPKERKLPFSDHAQKDARQVDEQGGKPRDDALADGYADRPLHAELAADGGDGGHARRVQQAEHQQAGRAERRELARQGRALLHTVNVPGPTAAILGPIGPEDLRLAAGIVAHYGDRGGLPQITVRHLTPEGQTEFAAAPLPREAFEPWML